MSRRQFVRTAATTSALAIGATLVWPGVVAAAPPSDASPNPIPGGTDLEALLGLPPGPIFHFFFPAFGNEVSTITDLNGVVAAGEIQGTGLTNTSTSLTYDADMRFMSGEYVGVDGHPRQGTFGFV